MHSELNGSNVITHDKTELSVEIKKFFDSSILEVNNYLSCIDQFGRLPKDVLILLFTNNIESVSSEKNELKETVKNFRIELGRHLINELFNEVTCNLSTRNQVNLMLDDIYIMTKALINKSISTDLFTFIKLNEKNKASSQNVAGMQTVLTEFEIVKNNYSSLVQQLNAAHKIIESHTFLISKLSSELNSFKLKSNNQSIMTDVSMETAKNNRKRAASVEGNDVIKRVALPQGLNTPITRPRISAKSAKIGGKAGKNTTSLSTFQYDHVNGINEHNQMDTQPPVLYSNIVKTPNMGRSKPRNIENYRSNKTDNLTRNNNNNPISKHKKNKTSNKPNINPSNKPRSSKVLVIGTGASNSLCGVPRRFHFCLSRLNSSTSTENIKKHVTEFLNEVQEDDIQVEEIERGYTSSNKMFKLSVSSTHGDKITDKNNWPEHVHIKRFFNKHTNNARNANNENAK